MSAIITHGIYMKHTIRKAVITAAGWGTRFLPATKAQPKEMLPLVDKPLIQYAVEEALNSGIEQIIVVTAMGKRAIEDHFDRSVELERVLEHRGEIQLLREVQRLSNLVDICYTRQKEQLGLGHAVLTACNLVGSEPFAVLLPDDIIQAKVPVLKQMIEIYEEFGKTVIAVEKVPKQEVHKYGIVNGRKERKDLYKVLGLVEKPAPEKAPSNLGIVGRYILNPDILEELSRTGPDVGGEIQLTNGLNSMASKEDIYAYLFKGKRYDAGTPMGLLKATVEIALKHPAYRKEFSAYLKELSADL